MPTARSGILKVHFYAIAPEPIEPAFIHGHYPFDEVRTRIRSLDPASEEYRIGTDLLGSGVLCLFHEDGPVPLLGAYYKDMFTTPLTEYKGEIATLVLREGEGLVDASFAAFFPDDVVGIVRTSPKAPGHSRLADWLSSRGGTRMRLVPLRNPGAWKGVKGSRRFGALRIKVRPDLIPDIEPRSHDVAQALRQAASLTRATREVGIEISPGHADPGTWTSEIEDIIDQLGDLLPSFLVADLRLPAEDGQPAAKVSLRQGMIVVEVPTVLVNGPRLGPVDAAIAIHKGFERNQVAIRASVAEARR